MCGTHFPFIWRFADHVKLDGGLLRLSSLGVLECAYPFAGQPYGLSSRSRSVYSCSRPNQGCMHR